MSLILQRRWQKSCQLLAPGSFRRRTRPRQGMDPSSKTTSLNRLTQMPPLQLMGSPSSMRSVPRIYPSLDWISGHGEGARTRSAVPAVPVRPGVCMTSNVDTQASRTPSLRLAVASFVTAAFLVIQKLVLSLTSSRRNSSSSTNLQQVCALTM